ncbi:hypothetical protein ACIQWA_36745 [Kitasatospora sp. NPDC098652]|uniref:hypothetical protein n=1 Tax=Kitasatospora sp. NPDC098652 TaxID=3364095 RepID=UPI0038309C99
MIHIKLGPRTAARTDDPLGRSHTGWEPGMTDHQLYEAGRGAWVLGAKADRERYLLLAADGLVRQAIEIDRLVQVTSSRRAAEGTVLAAGHPVHDAYVGKPSPVPATVRNPVTYIDSVLDVKACACGCGESTTTGWFVPGHDQKALHERVAQIGTVHEFIQWFDRTHPGNQAD